MASHEIKNPSSGSALQFARKASWALPVVLGILFALGDSVASNNGDLVLRDPSLLVRILLFTAVFSIAFYIAEKLFNARLRAQTQDARSTLSSALSRFFFDDKEITCTLRIWALIALCWIPWLFLLYPGVFWSDTSQELLEHYGLAVLSDHHPYLMTLLLGWFADLGRTLFASEMGGLFILIIIQCLVVTYYFSRFILLFRTMGLSNGFCLALGLFVGIFPFVPFMFSSLVKDTVSAACFTGFCYHLFCIVKSNGAKMRQPRCLIPFVVLALLCSLTKKTAGYIVLVTLIVLLVYCLKRKAGIQAFSAVAIVGVLVFLVFPKAVLPANSVEPGGKQEMVATLIQQVAHDVVYDADNMTADEQELVDDFLLIDYDKISGAYNWQIVDPVKDRSLNNESRMGEFVLLWAKKTIENPAGHLEAWLGLVDGWVTFRIDEAGTPNNMVVCSYSGWYYDGIEEVTDWNPEITSGGKIAETIYRAFQSMPVLNMLFLRSTWATVFPFFAVFLIMRMRKRKMGDSFIVLLPLLLSVATLSIVPVSVMGGEPTRYLLAMVCVSPFLMVGAALIGSSGEVKSCSRADLEMQGESLGRHSKAGLQARPRMREAPKPPRR